MADSFPTFMPRKAIEAEETRKYDDLVKTAVLPSEPHRVKLEQDRFNEMASQAVLPSQQADQTRIAQEQARFYEMATKDAGPPAGADSSAPPSPAVADQPAADTPVQRTMAYLAKLGGHDDARPASAGPAPETAQQTQAGAQKDASPYPTSFEDAARRAIDQAQQPDNPGLSMGLARVFPSKPVLPDSEGRDKVLSGQPLDAQDFVTLATKATQAQQSTQPAAMEADGLDQVLPKPLAALAGGPVGGLGMGEKDIGRGAEKALGAEGTEATAKAVYGEAAQSLRGRLSGFRKRVAERVGSILAEGEIPEAAQRVPEHAWENYADDLWRSVADDAERRLTGKPAVLTDEEIGQRLDLVSDLRAAVEKRAEDRGYLYPLPGEAGRPDVTHGQAETARDVGKQFAKDNPASPPWAFDSWPFGQKPGDSGAVDRARASAVSERIRARIDDIEAQLADTSAALPSATRADLERERDGLRGSLGRAGMDFAIDAGSSAAGGATGYVSREPQRPDESDEDYQARIAKAVGVGALGGALAPTVARGAGRALGGFLSGESRMVPGTGNAAKPPKEITPEVEALADGPGWPTKTPGWRLRLDRTRNVVGWMGDAGAEIADRAQKWRNDSEVMAADFIRQMPTVRKLSKPEMENLVDVLERGRVGAAAKAVPLNERVVQAAGEAKAVLDDLYTLAQNAGVDVAGKIESYFPHRFKGDVLDRINNRTERAKIVEYLKKTGQADDDAEANQVMQRYVQAASDRRHGSLEMERLANLPGYEKTKEALYAHVLSASRRINEVAAFGRDDAIVNRLIDKLGADGYDVGVARDMFQTIVGAKPQDEWKLARGLRSYNAFTRLGFAALSNATQPVNTASVVGVIRAAQSAPKAIWSKADRDFAEKAGVTLDTVMKEVREGSGWSDRAIPGLGGTSASDIAMPAFNMVESFNRRFTAIAGRDFAIEQARKAVSGNTQARRALDALGLDADAIIRRGGKLNEREQIDAARSMVDRTQFRVDPQDLPAWASSPWGKVFTQFAPFGYQQTLFIGRELLNEAKNGNVMPLVRYAILAPLANAGATEARNALQGRDPEENPYKRVTQYALGTTGTLGNLARAVLPINSQKLPAERQGQMLVGAAFGPSVGLVADAGTSLVQAGHGLARAGSFGLDEKTLRQLTPVGRTALRQLPVFGVPLQNTLLPYDEDKPRLALPGGDGRNDRRDSRRR